MRPHKSLLDLEPQAKNVLQAPIDLMIFTRVHVCVLCGPSY